MSIRAHHTMLLLAVAAAVAWYLRRDGGERYYTGVVEG